jgi:REP-associated tyrosine transposase
VARQARGTVHAGIYHVFRRSAGPIPMFNDDIDRTDFCNRLGRTITKFGWACHAFCLMTTHYHLMVTVDENALQPGMRWLNGPYAQAFNLRWGRSGHLRGGPYGLRRIEDETQLLTCFRYVALNPVDGGLCTHPAEWPWSSYRGTAGYDDGFWFVTNDLVLDAIHDDRTKAQRLLRLLVEPEQTGSIPAFKL